MRGSRTRAHPRSRRLRAGSTYSSGTEKKTQIPRATLRHSDCVEAPDCEAAKTREAFTLYWELGSADPDKTRTEAWCRDYKMCLDVLHQFADRFGDRFGDRGYDWLVVRQWLLEWN